MANHKSSLKRIRQEETRRLHNRYYGKTMRNAVRKLRATTDKAEAVAMYPGITKMLDKQHLKLFNGISNQPRGAEHAKRREDGLSARR